MIPVLGPDGAPALLQDGALSLEEGRRYLVALPSDAQVVFSDRPLSYDPAAGGFVVQPDYNAGHGWLRADWSGERVQLPVTTAPRSDKLDPHAWGAMLEDLARWAPTATVGLGAQGHGGVSVQGLPTPILLQALSPLLPTLVQSLWDVLAHLRTRTRAQTERRSLATVRQVRPQTVRWLTRHPGAAAWVLPGVEPGTRLPHVPVPRSTETLNTPANRAVVWLVRAVASRLTQLSARLAGVAPGIATDHDWAQARAASLTHGAERLTRALRRSALARVRPAAPDDAALLVLADDPWYARFHRWARLFLAPAFAPQGGHAPAPSRPTFELYEMWCFLALRARLAGALTGWTWQHLPTDLFHDLGSGAGLSVRATGPQGTLTLGFNRTFLGVLDPRRAARWSLAKQRRPDVVVVFEPVDGSGRWVVLDAKYRVTTDSVADAFQSVHTYANGLRWVLDGRDTPPRGTVLLTPSRPDPAPWYTPAFRRAHGCGALRLRPGSAEHQVTQWILSTLEIDP